jgi:hypothetical protein
MALRRLVVAADRQCLFFDRIAQLAALRGSIRMRTTCVPKFLHPHSSRRIVDELRECLVHAVGVRNGKGEPRVFHQLERDIGTQSPVDIEMRNGSCRVAGSVNE